MRIVGFAAVEGICFSGSFCAIYWFRKDGKMPGLTHSNEFIARDEKEHRDFACLIYRHLQKKLPREIIIKIIEEAVELEKDFINEALRADLIGITKKQMAQYIECVADSLLFQLGEVPHYKVENPFTWMEIISYQRKINFFEHRNSDYKKAHVETALRKRLNRENTTNGTTSLVFDNPSLIDGSETTATQRLPTIREGNRGEESASSSTAAACRRNDDGCLACGS